MQTDIKNGIYFRYKNVLVIASIDGLTLSLVKKFDIIQFQNAKSRKKS